MSNVRETLINSICQQKMYFLMEHTANPDVRIFVSAEDRAALLQQVNMVEWNSNYDINCEPKEQFCGCELKVDKLLKPGKYRLEILVDYHVIRVVNLTF